MSNEVQSTKRLTFQGIINAEKEKVPESTSRSKSKNRSKVSSLSKNISRSNISRTSIRKTETNIVENNSTSDVPNTSRVNQNIFRQNKRSAEQQMMKKIIKLKNYVTKLENTIKQNANEPVVSSAELAGTNTNDKSANSKYQQMSNFLQEFDAELMLQTRQIADSYFAQLEGNDFEGQRELKAEPEYKFMHLPHSNFQMGVLQGRLDDLQKRW